MANRKNNRSAQRTQRAVKEAFVELASERPLARISVADVAERADISRGTFYLYFHDLLDLRDVIGDDFADAFDAEVGEHEATTHPIENGFAMLAAGFEFMREQRETLAVLLGPNGDVAFQRRFENIVRRYCLAGIEDNFGDMGEDLFQRFYAYHIAGAVGAIRDWLSRGCDRAPEEMSQFIGTMLMASADALAKEGVHSR